MLEELKKIMTEEMGLPKQAVDQFLIELLHQQPKAKLDTQNSDQGLEQLREATADLLQSLVLESRRL